MVGSSHYHQTAAAASSSVSFTQLAQSKSQMEPCVAPDNVVIGSVEVVELSIEAGGSSSGGGGRNGDEEKLAKVPLRQSMQRHDKPTVTSPIVLEPMSHLVEHRYYLSQRRYSAPTASSQFPPPPLVLDRVKQFAREHLYSLHQKLHPQQQQQEDNSTALYHERIETLVTTHGEPSPIGTESV